MYVIHTMGVIQYTKLFLKCLNYMYISYTTNYWLINSVKLFVMPLLVLNHLTSERVRQGEMCTCTKCVKR